MADQLDQLAAALAEERRALLEQDVPRLLDSSQMKRAALEALESNPVQGQGARVAELHEDNRLNGVLLARRMREVELVLHHLGQPHETAPGYNAQGQQQQVTPRRVLAVA